MAENSILRTLYSGRFEPIQRKPEPIRQELKLIRQHTPVPDHAKNVQFYIPPEDVIHRDEGDVVSVGAWEVPLNGNLMIGLNTPRPDGRRTVTCQIVADRDEAEKMGQPVRSLAEHIYGYPDAEYACPASGNFVCGQGAAGPDTIYGWQAPRMSDLKDGKTLVVFAQGPYSTGKDGVKPNPTITSKVMSREEFDRTFRSAKLPRDAFGPDMTNEKRAAMVFGDGGLAASKSALFEQTSPDVDTDGPDV